MLRFLCVALTVVAEVVCGHWSAPLHAAPPPGIPLPPFTFFPSSSLHGGKFKRTSTSGTGSEVVWLTECSPRRSLVRRRQDAQLKCDAVVPDGTKLTWYKEHQPLQRPGVQQSVQVLQEIHEETTNEVGASLEAATPLNVRLHVSSVVYIDCADEADVAEYSLELRTPSRNVYVRNFTVLLRGVSLEDGSTCGVAAGQLEFLPRIYHHAKRAWPTVGGSLVLPCRAQGHRLRHTWYAGDASVGNTNPNYQVLDNGDLIIRTVGPNTPAVFICQVSSAAENALQGDFIRTQIAIRSS